MPPTLRNRAADNWRVLLAIADDLGHGEAARSAAVALCANRPDEDPGVTLLADARTVFEALGFDRIASSALVEALILHPPRPFPMKGARGDGLPF